MSRTVLRIAIVIAKWTLAAIGFLACLAAGAWLLAEIYLIGKEMVINFASDIMHRLVG